MAEFSYFTKEGADLSTDAGAEPWHPVTAAGSDCLPRARRALGVGSAAQVQGHLCPLQEAVLPLERRPP